MAFPYRSALLIAMLYWLASLLWWWGTGRLLNNLFHDNAAVAHWQLVSGYVWGAASALLIFAWRSRLLGLLRRQQQAGAASRERLSMAEVVFDATLEGVLVTDPHNTIVHVNRAFIEITGYDEHEVLGHKPSKFKSGRHDAAFYQRVYQALASAGQWSGEIWNRRKNGEVYPQWQTIRAVRDAAGRVTHYVAVFSDISVAKRSEQQLAHLAWYDALTELPNRLLLQDRLGQSLRQAQAGKQGRALLLVDLDDFQAVNDSYGHSCGDRVLRACGERLQSLLPAPLTLARLGGDEFAVLDEQCASIGAAAALAQRVLAALAEPFEVNGGELFLNASVGISLFPNDAQDAEQLLRNADSALFEAKHNGRAGYAFYTQALTAQAQQRLRVAAELRRALEQHELRVFYQPVHRLSDGRLAGFEALVRWQHPERGLVPPGEFIPVAEQTGLIADIDRWVMAQACQQMIAWQQAGHGLAFMAVNLSSRLFGRPELEHWVAQVLAETGLAPGLLELEVTESAVMQDTDSALEQLHRLRGLGLRLAIDDFGTGYSSLLRLKNLPVHKLKVDQGFVAGLPGDASDVAIVQAIVVLARSLGMQVHAEGIEQPEQAAFLAGQACELGQGY
ncbi:phosphodiesterase DibA [Pseudomonas sp. NPDC007930]|uniref:phosphodiesterase DibA n=1 Tax=Pseudomonas sp. NPDC007930 TaxID=3364417 RepID=UPI0036EF1565